MHPLGANIQQQITSFVITEFIFFSQSLQSFVSRDLILKVKLTPVTRQSAVSIRWSPTICRWAVSKAGVGAVVLDVVVSSLLSCPTLVTPWTHHAAQHVALLRPWDFPGKSTGVGCVSFSRGASPSGDWTCISCIGRQILYCWVTREDLCDFGHPFENQKW